MIANWFLIALSIVQQNPPTEASDLDQAMALLQQLDATTLSVEYRQEKLENVMEDLSTRLSMPLRGDWASLGRLGVDSDDVITLRTNPGSASAVLASVSLMLGEEFERPLFEIHRGQIVLTTIAASAAMRVTGVYDVRDLLADQELIQRLRDEAPATDAGVDPTRTEKPTEVEQPDSANQEPPSPPPEAPDIAPNPPPNPNRRQPFAIPDFQPSRGVNSEPRQVSPPTPGESLYMLITDHVDPDAWKNFGGDRAHVSDRDGVLMVTATPSTHRGFREALASLRRANPKSISIEAFIIDLPRSSYEQLMRKHPAKSARLASALRGDSQSSLVWRASESVAMDAKLEVESASGGAQVHVLVSPHFDSAGGVLRIVVDAGTRNGDDVRSIKTTTALLGDDGAAIFELPAAKPADAVRFLVLVPQRR